MLRPSYHFLGDAVIQNMQFREIWGLNKVNGLFFHLDKPDFKSGHSPASLSAAGGGVGVDRLFVLMLCRAKLVNFDLTSSD